MTSQLSKTFRLVTVDRCRSWTFLSLRPTGRGPILRSEVERSRSQAWCCHLANGKHTIIIIITTVILFYLSPSNEAITALCIHYNWTTKCRGGQHCTREHKEPKNIRTFHTDKRGRLFLASLRSKPIVVVRNWVWSIVAVTVDPLGSEHTRSRDELSDGGAYNEVSIHSSKATLTVGLLIYYIFSVFDRPGTGVPGRRLSAQHAPTPINRHSDVCRPTIK